MDYLKGFFEQIFTNAGAGTIRVFWALCVLVLGWILASIIAKAIDNWIRKTQIDQKLAPSLLGDKAREKELDFGLWVSKVVYYFLLIVVIGAFLHVLKFEIISEPLQQMLNKILAYFPNLFTAALLFLIAWGSATLLRLLFIKGATTLKLDDKIAGEIDLKEDGVSFTKTIGDTVYWLTFLVFLPLILENLQFTAMLDSVNSMWVKIMDFLPHIFAAAVTLLIGWFLARVIERITTNLLAALGVDQLSDKTGIAKVFGKQKMSAIIGLIVYIFILLNVLVMALETLQLQYLTTPFIDLLQSILGAVPRIFTAGAILVIAYIVAQIVSEMAKNLLTNIGFDSLFVKLGLVKEVGKGDYAPAQVAGRVVKIAIMFFAVIIACEKLKFVSLVQLGNGFMVFAGRILLGLIIFVVGVYLANLAVYAIKAGKGDNVNLLAQVTRGIILIFTCAVALQQVVPENEIVVWAFILLGGAVSIAIAIAFGVGGISIATRKMEDWLKLIEDKSDK